MNYLSRLIDLLSITLMGWLGHIITNKQLMFIFQIIFSEKLKKNNNSLDCYLLKFDGSALS